MPIDGDSSRRVYRHRPWLIVAALAALFTTGCIAAVVAYVVRSPSIESVLVLVPLAAFEAFLVLSFRWRTVVDDTGITQHWISRSYPVPYAEITGLEPVHTYLRWYLRVHCGDRTFEMIPCHTVIWSPLAAAVGPPRAMRAAEADIRSRLGNATRIL